METLSVPSKLKDFMYAIMKEARRDSLVDLLDNYDIDVYSDDYTEIVAWFSQFGIEL